MPIYEYRCPTCGHEFERLAKVGEPNPPCPNGCPGVITDKLVSRSSFHLSGGGWAADSYGEGLVSKKP